MQILYDEEGDVLDVKFRDSKQNAATAGYELRQGVVIYVSAKMEPLQLTVVSYRRLIELPVIHFDRLEAQSEAIRKKLLPIIASPPVSAILRLDPITNYGHMISPELLDVCVA